VLPSPLTVRDDDDDDEVSLCTACAAAGIVASYWNVAFYPEWCSNVELDDTAIYTTVVRVSGAWAGIADALKQVHPVTPVPDSHRPPDATRQRCVVSDVAV